MGRPSYRGVTLAEGVRIENPHPGQFVFVTEATGNRVLVDAEDNEIVEGLKWAQDHPSHSGDDQTTYVESFPWGRWEDARQAAFPEPGD